MKRIKGQSLAEFAIIVALIAIAGILALVFLGDEVKKMFGISSNKYSSYKPFEFGATNSTTNLLEGKPKAGSLGGTPDKPVSQCDGDMCTIDFGEMILTGIPKEFNNYVDNVGASGGSDMISALLLQIAQQMEEQGKLTEAETIKKMAVTGHNIASIQKYIEERYNSCNGDKTCIYNLNNEMAPKEIISNFDETYYKYSDDYLSLRALGWSTSIADARSQQVDHPNAYQEDLNSFCIGATFIEEWDKLKTSGVSEVTKNIIDELSWDLGTISEQFWNNFAHEIVYDPTDLTRYRDFADPITGKYYTAEDDPALINENFENYKASKISHFDSALICASGKSTDSGVKCH